MSAERTAADRLNDHLDVIVAVGSTPPALDPAMEAAVAGFFAADDAPGPPPDLADRIWDELLEQDRFAELVPQSPSIPAVRDGRQTPGAMPASLERRGLFQPRWTLAQLATAALVLLTVISGFVALQGSLRMTGPGQPGVIIPAIDRTSELPSGGIADEMLLRATLEQMPPSGGTHQLAMYRVQLAPGTTEHAGSQADTGVGHDLFTVESGQVTVEADAPVILTRAVADPAAAPTSVPAGTAVVLDVGDQLLAPSGVTFRRRNDDSTPATLLGYSFGNIGESVHTWSNPAGVTYVHGFPFTLPSEFPALPAEVTVRRLTLAPGAELAVRDLRGLELVYVEAGALDLVYAKAETAATPERVFTIRAGSGTDTFGRTPEKALLANRGAEPLVLLTASIVPSDTGDATPRAP
jgi:hypothetical protein